MLHPYDCGRTSAAPRTASGICNWLCVGKKLLATAEVNVIHVHRKILNLVAVGEFLNVLLDSFLSSCQPEYRRFAAFRAKSVCTETSLHQNFHETRQLRAPLEAYEAAFGADIQAICSQLGQILPNLPQWTAFASTVSAVYRQTRSSAQILAS